MKKSAPYFALGPIAAVFSRKYPVYFMQLFCIGIDSAFSFDARGPLHLYRNMRYPSLLLFFLSLPLLLIGCASTSPPAALGSNEQVAGPQGREVAMHALMLLQTAYRFGGKNPDAGLDCSGLVTLVYRKAADIELAGNAAWMARQGRPVTRAGLRSGDLVFFNTLNRPFSHVGIYIGRGEFIHAPSSRGRVRVDRMDNAYFAARYEAARTFFD